MLNLLEAPPSRRRKMKSLTELSLTLWQVGTFSSPLKDSSTLKGAQKKAEECSDWPGPETRFC